MHVVDVDGILTEDFRKAEHDEGRRFCGDHAGVYLAHENKAAVNGNSHFE